MEVQTKAKKNQVGVYRVRRLRLVNFMVNFVLYDRGQGHLREWVSEPGCGTGGGETGPELLLDFKERQGSSSRHQAS